MIQAKLEDGRILEFPDGTSQSVVQKSVKELLAKGTPEPQKISQQFPNAITGDVEAKYEPKKSMGQSLAEELPQTAGAMATGVAASAAGAGMAASVGLVALGGGAGEAFKQIGQNLSGSLDAPKTSTEAAKRVAKASGMEGLFELAGGLFVKGARKVLAPYRSRMTEGAIRAMDYFKNKIKPIVFTPAEATESRVLDLLSNISESSLVGGSGMADFKLGREKFFNEFADNLIDEFGGRTDPSDLGNLFLAALERKKAVHKEVATTLYNRVSELVNEAPDRIITKTVNEKIPEKVSGKFGLKYRTRVIKESVPAVSINTDAVKAFAKHPRKLASEIGGIEAKNAGDDLIDAMMDLPDELSFDAAKELRSRLIARVDEFSVFNKKAPAIGKAKKMISMLDEQIGMALKRLDKNANSLYKLTDVDKKAISVFTGEEGPGMLLEMRRGEKNGIYSEYINDLDNAVSRSVLSSDSTVWRGFQDVEGIFDNIKPGDTFTDPAFVSTSKSKGVARDFIDNTVNDIQDPVMIEIKTKKGSIGLETGSEYENEVILPKNSKFKIIEVVNNPDIKEAGKLIRMELIDGSMNATSGESAYDAWRTANKFYRDGQEKFNSTFLRRMVKLADDTGTGAENIAPQIFRPGQVSRVRKVKAALGSTSSEWKSMQGFFMQHILSKSTDTSGAIVGTRLLNNISGKPGSFGTAMIHETFSPAQVEALTMFGRAAKIAQARQAEGAGKVLIQLTQAGAVLTLATKGLELPAATVIFGPEILSKIMLNPAANRWLTEGILLPVGSERVGGVVARLTEAAWRVNHGVNKGPKEFNKKVADIPSNMSNTELMFKYRFDKGGR